MCGEGGDGQRAWGRETEVEISGVFVNADGHIAELPNIFLRESAFFFLKGI